MLRVALVLCLLGATLAHSSASAQVATRFAMVRVSSSAELNEVATRYELQVTPLMARAGIYRVASAHFESGVALARALEREVASQHLLAVEPDYAIAHHAASINVPPDDERYGGQWYLARINIEGAWRVSTGSPSTTIAVIDDGCDTTHPDLVGHLLPGYDAFDDDDDPSYLPNVNGNAHGTACAGIVGADTDNGIGMAGTCPECSVRCIRLLGESGSLVPVSADINAFNFALENGAAVISNSWGFEHGTPVSFMLRTAINTVMSEGRDGLGTVVVFAAGNDAAEINANELQAIPGIVNVGALNNFDEATSFSNFGPSLTVTAPTGTLTLDIQGDDGDTDSDYTSLFGGTSSSAPVVAGVAALIIDANPTLTGAEVARIIRESARAAPFATPDENGHDPIYGYGVIDPEAAIRAALPEEPDAGVEDAAVLDAASDAGTATPAPNGCQCDAAGQGPHFGLLHCLFLGAIMGVVVMRKLGRGKNVLAILATLLLSACVTSDGSLSVSKEELRPDTPGSTELPPRFDPTDVVETLASPANAFRIHYTRGGANAVPSADTDASGVPDYVELVASTYDEVLAFYQSLSFRTPTGDSEVPTDNGGDALFDVYLVDFGGSADGAYRRELCDAVNGCTGYMLQENDFTGYHYPSRAYAARLLASHEYFHAVQAAYDGERSAQGSVLSEGSAVWASEEFDGAQSDLEDFANAYFMRTDKSLGVDPIGPVQSYSYGAGVLFEFLSQHYEVDLVRKLWDEVHMSPDVEWLDSLDAVLMADESSSFEDAFVEFARWNWFTSVRAREGIGYEQAVALPQVTEVTMGLPYNDDSIRLQPASIRYYRLSASASSTLELSVSSEETLSGVHVLAAPQSANTIGEVTELTLPHDTVTANFDSNAMLFAIVDARTTGAGQVISFCVATSASGECAPVEEVDAGMGACDGGVGCGDASASPIDMGFVIGPPEPPRDCQIAHAGSATRPGLFGLFGLLGMATIVLLRRRRTSR